jgi:hypothetical protein
MQKENNDIVIITGAGISNLFGLPMTSGFKSLINESSRFHMKDLLSNYLGNEIIDIEKVMYTLEDCLNEENKNLQHHILDRIRYHLSIILSYGDQVNQEINNAFHDIMKNAREYLLYLKTGIYNFLDNPEIDKASLLYYNILVQIKTKHPDSKISIFTTNYDLSFEKACRSSKEKLKKIGIDTDAIDYGFILQDGILVFNEDIKNNERKYLEYYKLHGSLDWHYDDFNGCTKSGANAKPSSPDIMPILYPGIKGKPKKEPFIKLHEIFYDRLQSANIVIALGFAFRDPYINDLIKFSKITNKNYKMSFFNPAKQDDLPQESGIHEFKEFFKEDLIYINSKIEIIDKPLGEYFN